MGRLIVVVLAAFFVNAILVAFFPFLWNEAFFFSAIGMSVKWTMLTFPVLCYVGSKMTD